MLLGLLADTHDNVAAAESAVARFEAAGADVLLHAGDVVAPPTVDAFSGFEVHAVLGNNDGEVQGLDAAFDRLGTDSALHGRFADLTFDGRDVAVLHGESLAEVDAVACGDYDLVVYGHHHETADRRVGDTLVVNPGAHFPTVPSTERRVAVYDTDEDAVEFHAVE